MAGRLFRKKARFGGLFRFCLAAIKLSSDCNLHVLMAAKHAYCKLDVPSHVFYLIENKGILSFV